MSRKMKPKRRFYATFDPRADLDNGNRGFANTVEISRFRSREDRDDFVATRKTWMAKAVTRKEAADAFAAIYHCVGKTPPAGGLFGAAVEWINHEAAPGQTASVRY